jgi:uncharacterized protein
MKLILLDEELAVVRLERADPTPAWAARGCLSSVTRTADELSIVCAAAAVPPDVPAKRGWRCFQVAGPLDFSLTGILASIVSPLAAARISIFAIATYDTDYVLVRGPDLASAAECLRAAGHEVIEGDDREQGPI